MLKTFLLVVLLSTQWKPPVPYDFVVENDDFRVSVTESIRDDEVKGKILVRMFQIRYYDPKSLLAEGDRLAARVLGATPEDTARIDTVQYSGVSHRKSPKVQYIFCKFFAGDVPIASKEITSANDPYNRKAIAFYEFARGLHDEERKKKPGDEPGFGR